MASDPPRLTLFAMWSGERKLFVTLLIMLAAGLIPSQNWPWLLGLLAVSLLGLLLAGLPRSYAWPRLAAFLPFIVFLGIAAPLWSQETNPWRGAAVLTLRMLISFLAGLWLVWVLPFGELIRTLQRLHVPGLLLVLLSFTARFLGLLQEESQRLQRARLARTIRPRSMWQTWCGLAQLLGQLLLRSLDRGERVHQAMLARGWDGTPRFLEPPPSSIPTESSVDPTR